MRLYCFSILAVLMAVLFSGCETVYPMGLNEQQWNALGPAQQAEYRARQYEVDQERQRVREARHAEEEHRKAVAAQLELERIQERYLHARPGDVVVVSIRGGMVAFYGKRHEYEPVSFELVRGEKREIEFRRVGSRDRTRVQVALSEDGRTFFFDYPSRRRYVLVNRSWDRGEEYRPPEIRGNDGYSEAINLNISIRHSKNPHRGRR